MIEMILGFTLCLIAIVCASYLFIRKSDEMEYLRNLLSSEIEHRKMRENELLTYLRVRPSIPVGSTTGNQSYVAGPSAVSRGGIREFRQRQQEAEAIRIKRTHDEELRRKNPEYNPDQLAADIAELDAELGTNG